VEGHTDRGSHRGARQIHNRLTRFSSHLISYFLSSSSATLRRHSRIPSATRARRACPRTRRQGPTARTAAATTAAVSFPTLFLIFIIELSYAAAPLAHTISDPRKEGLPSHPPTRTNGADRRSDHSSRFFSHLIPYFYHRAQLRCGATRAYHQRPAHQRSRQGDSPCSAPTANPCQGGR
jgi:hypothetical protein